MEHRRVGGASAAGLLTALGLMLVALVPCHAEARREIPIGVFNVNNSALTEGPSRMYAIRFVLDAPAPIYRFFSGMNWEGVYTDERNAPAPREIRARVRDKGYPSPPAPSDLPAEWSTGDGRPHYAHGNGGRIRARLVPMKPDGTPDLSLVLAEETFDAVRRYREAQSYGGPEWRSAMVYSNFGGHVVAGGVPYFVVYQNVHHDPRNNFVSVNSPVVSEAAAGPNGRNTLDPAAPGAIMGLDPREAVAWTTDGGFSWRWGQQVGGGRVPGDYTGSGDNGTRLPWYAWQEEPRGEPQEPERGRLYSNQPFYAYKAHGSYTLRVNGVPHKTTLTEAGGYAPGSFSVGAITVENLRTGVVGATAPLGTGLVRGPLTPNVTVDVGDAYEIRNSGTVAKAEGDLVFQRMGLIGPGRTPYQTAGHGYDRAELFALPHPFFALPAAHLPPVPR